ncbi:MAG: hypothetical protein RML40_08215 [Bacteroidota bacterium]|nr:hypothetical protein [Candidatus Kapabacteria bacterium]MDW8220499.1 hypothetical protein [Bacteroidota bacterium]
MIPRAAAATLVLEHIQPSQSGTYVCRATNSRLPELVNITRSLAVIVTGSNVALEAPELIFPPHNAENIATRPRLVWSSVDGAKRYEVTIARDARLEHVVVQRIVADSTMCLVGANEMLERGERYFWCVRALTLGNVGEQSSISQFRVVPVGMDIAISTIDAGHSSIGNHAIGYGVLVNLASRAVTLDSAHIERSTVFTLLDKIQGRLEPNAEFAVRVRFAPVQSGQTTATLRLWYNDGQERQEAFVNVIRGRGAALRVDDVIFEAVRVGKTALKALRILNRSASTVILRAMHVQTQGPGELGRQSAAIFGIASDMRSDTLYAGDTMFVPVRCSSLREIDAHARIIVHWEVDGVRDSVVARLIATVRLVHADNPSVVVGIRPKVYNVPPGTTVPMEMFVAEGNLEALAQAAVPSIRVPVAFDRSVLREQQKAVHAQYACITQVMGLVEYQHCGRCIALVLYLAHLQCKQLQDSVIRRY